MGGACGAFGGQHKYIQGLLEKPKEGDHLGDVGVDVKIILKWTIPNLGWEGMD